MELGIYMSYNNIGYAVIDNNQLVVQGVCNVNITADEKNEYIRGKSISTNPNRTLKRQARVNLERYRQRREELYQWLKNKDMLPKSELSDKSLWELRAKAPQQKLSSDELGAVLIHLAKKRGYKPTGDRQNESSEYLADLESNTKDLHDSGLTIGQYLYKRYEQGLRLKEILFKREDYEAEFYAIVNQQTDNLTTGEIAELYRIIYYQRPLKSQKHKVSRCKYTGRRVAHKSNPYFQEYKILSEIENVKIYDAYGRDIPINEDKLQELCAALMVKDKMTAIQILKLLGYNAKADKVGLNYDKVLSGNITYSAINKIVPDFKPNDEELYKLWHLLYSVKDDSKIKVLQETYNFTEQQSEELSAIDFDKHGYCSLSEKAIKAILVHLREKKNLHDSIKLAGLKEIVDKDEFLGDIPLFKPNSFRNIVIEKSANRFISLINKLRDQYNIDDCVIDFDPLLLRSNKSRNDAIKRKRIKANEDLEIRKELSDNYQLFNLSNRDIIKYRLWSEFNGKSPYEPGKSISIPELFDKNSDDPYEVEHIIPLSRLFDNSLNNKTICRRSINIEKDNKTAAEYMSSREDYQQYLEAIEAAKISFSKKKYFTIKGDEVNSNYVSFKTKITHPLSKHISQALHRAGINARFTHSIISNHLKNIWDLRDDEVVPDKSDDLRLFGLNAIIAGYTSEAIINQLNDLNKNYVEARNLGVSLRNFDSPFDNASIRDIVLSIIPEYKVGKRLFTIDKNGHANPRFQLHKETIYGMIKRSAKNKKGEPITEDATVVKYPISSITSKDTKYIVDGKIREIVEQRLTQFGGNAGKAWEQPLLDHNGKTIRSIRLYTNLTKVRPLHYENGQWKDYVVEGNLHHVALYQDKDGKFYHTEVSGLTAIMRKNMGMDIIITNPVEANNYVENYSGKVRIDSIFLESMPESDWQYVTHYVKNMMVSYEDEIYRVHAFSGGRIFLMKPYHSDLADTSKKINMSYATLYKSGVSNAA